MVAALSGKHDSRIGVFFPRVVVFSVNPNALTFLSPLRLGDLPNVLAKITRAHLQTLTPFLFPQAPLKKVEGRKLFRKDA